MVDGIYYPDASTYKYCQETMSKVTMAEEKKRRQVREEREELKRQPMKESDDERAF